MEERLFHVAPWMPAKQAPADHDPHRPQRHVIVDQLTQPTTHPARQSNRDRLQGGTEMLRVQFPPALLEPGHHRFLPGPKLIGGARSRAGTLARDGPGQEHALGGQPLGPAGRGRYEAHDGMEDPVGRERILPMHAQIAPRRERDQHGPVLVGADLRDVVKTEGTKPPSQQFLGRRTQPQPRIRRQRSLPQARRCHEARARRRNGPTARTFSRLPASASAVSSRSRPRCERR